MNIITTISMMMIAMTTTTFRFQLSRPIEPTSQFEAKVREFNPRYAEAEGALLGQFRQLHTDIYGNQLSLPKQDVYIVIHCD